MSKMFYMCFSLSFIWLLIQFEFIFVYGIRKCSKFIILHVTVQFSLYHILTLKQHDIGGKCAMSGNSKSEHLEKMFSLCMCVLEQWNIFLDQYLSSNSTT